SWFFSRGFLRHDQTRQDARPAGATPRAARRWLDMKRYIITGAPGAVKTAITRQLELKGFGVVEEAATDVIAAAQGRGVLQPWTEPSFIDAVATLQRDRQIRAA